MTQYRTKRNLEKSLLYYITTILTSGSWTGVSSTLLFEKCYDYPIPVVQCGILTTNHKFAEIGDTNTYRETKMQINIFAENEGQRLDLSDYLVGELKKGFTYYTFTNTSGVETKVAGDFVHVTIEDDNQVDFGIAKDSMDKHDKYRHIITISCDRGVIEA